MYDPLVDARPDPEAAPASSYWQAHTHTIWPEPQQPPTQADIVVIGGGYTGLNAALELAERYQQQVVLLEANQLGWGCSTRNAGFAMPGTGRLGYQQWAERLGEQTAQAIQQEYRAGFAQLERHLAACPEQLQIQRGGYLKIAHKASTVTALKRQYEALSAYEPSTRWLDYEATQERLKSPQAHAALHFTHSFGVNPLLLASSIARQAAAAGAQLCPHQVVENIERNANGFTVRTQTQQIQAHKVLICSNGYTPNKLHPALHGRSLPVLSSVLVTRPLTATELAATGLTSQHLVMDTRVLKYYFRLLPDNRLLFGGRGAVRGKDANKAKYARHLLAALAATFPQLQRLSQQPPDYFWSGWVSVALDDYPRIYSPEPGLFTAMGYCGSGVTFTQVAGQRLAQLAMGEQLPALPFYQSELPRFPLASLRRLGQWGFYQWARLTQ